MEISPTLEAITANGTITFSGLNTAGIVINSNAGVLSTQQQLSALRGGTGIDSSGVTNGQLLIGGTSTGLHLANLTGGTGIGITNGNGAITVTNTGVTSLTGTANQVTVSECRRYYLISPTRYCPSIYSYFCR